MTNKEHAICELYATSMIAFRKDLGFTQADLSKETGYSVQTISKLENGKVPMGVAWKDILDYYISHCSKEILKKEERCIETMFAAMRFRTEWV
jgi:predicted transcriptional regulator